MIFTGASTLLAYLPADGANGPLDANLVDPAASASGVFGGDVAALKLNIDFGDAGLTQGNAHVAFGDLTICDQTALPALNGLTVREFSSSVNTLLGDGTGTYSIDQLDPVAQNLNAAFSGGWASAFAQQHLVNGTCP